MIRIQNKRNPIRRELFGKEKLIQSLPVLEIRKSGQSKAFFVSIQDMGILGSGWKCPLNLHDLFEELSGGHDSNSDVFLKSF